MDPLKHQEPQDEADRTVLLAVLAFIGAVFVMKLGGLLFWACHWRMLG